MTKMGMRQHHPHTVIPSFTDSVIMWVTLSVSRMRPWTWHPETILHLHYIDVLGCIGMLFVLLSQWISPKNHAIPPSAELFLIVLVFAITRFIIRVLVRTRATQDTSRFVENAAVEFSTKVSDVMTIAESVFFISGLLRMLPSSTFSLLIAMLNYHQIRVWRSQFRPSQGPALWVGGLTWEFLLLTMVAVLVYAFPLNWSETTPSLISHFTIDKYAWLTSASYNAVTLVSVLILLFQTSTTTFDLGMMLYTIKTEPGLRRQSMYLTVFRLFLVALIPNLVFNNLAIVMQSWGFGMAFCSFSYRYTSENFSPNPPFLVSPSTMFLFILFGHTSTLLQITYDRITNGPYGLFYLADLIAFVAISVTAMFCVDVLPFATGTMSLLFFAVWTQGIRKLSSRETIL